MRPKGAYFAQGKQQLPFLDRLAFIDMDFFDVAFDPTPDFNIFHRLDFRDIFTIVAGVFHDGIDAYLDDAREEKRTIHAVGNGTFVVDGDKLDRREMMRSKLPDGV